jgi:HD-GYP domain-containing protein (c-di-GMP phosphodiesterase class II)
MRIPIIDARKGMRVAQNIYGKEGEVLLRVGSELSEGLIESLRKRGVFAIEVEEENKSYAVEEDEKVDIISRELRSEAEEIVMDTWNAALEGKSFSMSKIKQVVEEVMDELLTKDYAFLKLADIRALDEYTFAHSVNVCVLSLLLGIIKNYSENRLYELGVGALLHDLGKTIIPPEILNKPGPLNNEEMAIVRKHPAYGFSLLCQEPDIAFGLALIAYQHHERCNGGGYPRGLVQGEIHEFAQIVAIVDVYDALTSDRPYRKSLLPYEAVETLVAMSAQELNFSIVKIFLENVDIYPVGSIVELNDHSTGIIVSVDKSLPVRPLIRMLVCENNHYVSTGTDINLMENNTLFIKKVLGINTALADKLL